MVSLFGLDRTIKYKGRHGRTVIYRQAAFDVLLGHMATHLTTLRLADHPRWSALRDIAVHATRPVDLETIEDEIDAIFCAHLAWLWVTAPERLMVFGDFDAGYIVTPPAPGLSLGRSASSGDGIVATGDARDDPA
jgi:predicted RNase H-like nuclease